MVFEWGEPGRGPRGVGGGQTRKETYGFEGAHDAEERRGGLLPVGAQLVEEGHDDLVGQGPISLVKVRELFLAESVEQDARLGVPRLAASGDDIATESGSPGHDGGGHGDRTGTTRVVHGGVGL